MIAKLVYNFTKLWFMIYLELLVNGVYKPTYNWGGPLTSDIKSIHVSIAFAGSINPFFNSTRPAKTKICSKKQTWYYIYNHVYIYYVYIYIYIIYIYISWYCLVSFAVPQIGWSIDLIWPHLTSSSAPEVQQHQLTPVPARQKIKNKWWQLCPIQILAYTIFFFWFGNFW